MESVTRAVEQAQHLTFLIGEEEYAVGILQVKEIIQYDTVTRVPKTPPWVHGVINLRGGVVPVVDLAVKFGLPGTRVTGSTCIVITEVELEGELTVMGLLADSVSEVITLRPEDVEPAPAFGTGVQTDYLLGMGKIGKKLVLMLDVDKVLSTEEILATSEVAAGRLAEDSSSELAPAPALVPEASAAIEAGV